MKQKGSFLSKQLERNRTEATLGPNSKVSGGPIKFPSSLQGDIGPGPQKDRKLALANHQKFNIIQDTVDKSRPSFTTTNAVGGTAIKMRLALAKAPIEYSKTNTFTKRTNSTGNFTNFMSR